MNTSCYQDCKFAKCLTQIVSHMHVYESLFEISYSLCLDFIAQELDILRPVARITLSKNKNFIFDPRRFDPVKPIGSAPGPIQSVWFWSNPLGFWDLVHMVVSSHTVCLILHNLSLLQTESIMCNEEYLFCHVLFKLMTPPCLNVLISCHNYNYDHPPW